MKRARLLVLIIAIAAAGGAAILAKNMVAPQTAAPNEIVKTKIVKTETTKVLVANGEIALGDVIGQPNMRWQDWPISATGAGYVTKEKSPEAIKELSGSLARAPFIPGEPIIQQKIIKASDGGVLAAILPSGMRAISTPIREETAAGGFILPNDRVDVIVTRSMDEQSSSNQTAVSQTVLKNVRVLAIGQNIEIKDGKKVANGKTATLELSPRQAEMISLARSMGEISLSLRSLADSSGPQQSADSPFEPTTSPGIKVLKYGVSSQIYGVN